MLNYLDNIDNGLKISISGWPKPPNLIGSDIKIAYAVDLRPLEFGPDD